MNEQQSLCSPPALVQPISRQKIIKRVFERADKNFIARYTACLIEFGGTHQDWIAGDVTNFYEKRNGKLSMREGKQIGGLYQSLQKEGLIVKTGDYRSRDNGNMTAVYRLK